MLEDMVMFQCRSGHAGQSEVKLRGQESLLLVVVVVDLVATEGVAVAAEEVSVEDVATRLLKELLARSDDCGKGSESDIGSPLEKLTLKTFLGSLELWLPSEATLSEAL